MDELVFEVKQEEDGSYSANAVGEEISAIGETWKKLGISALEATRTHFADSQPPPYIRLRHSYVEILNIA